MLLYLGLMLACLIIGYGFNINKKSKRRRIFFLTFAIVTVLLAALRNQVIGVDTPVYASWYKQFGTATLYQLFELSIINGGIEFGFCLLNKGLYAVSSNPQLLLIVTSVFSLTVIYAFIYKNSKDVVLSLTMFIGLQYFASWLNIMRQVLAISFILIGVMRHLKYKHPVRYALYVLVACLFHNSAVVCLSFVFLVGNKFRLLLNIFCTAVTVVAFFAYEYIVSILAKVFGYDNYIGTEFFESNFGGALIRVLLYLFLYMVIAFCYKKTYRQTRKAMLNDRGGVNLLTLCYEATFLTVLVYVVSMRLIIVERVAAYLSVFVLVLLPNCVSHSSKKDARIFRLMVVFVCLLYCVVVLSTRPEWFNITPYRFFWQEV